MGCECQGKSFDSARIGMVNPGLEPASGMNLVTNMPRLNGPQVSTIGFPSSFFSAEPQRLRRNASRDGVVGQISGAAVDLVSVVAVPSAEPPLPEKQQWQPAGQGTV
jgi:hypothetical protein